jgi:hypothetical protein
LSVRFGLPVGSVGASSPSKTIVRFRPNATLIEAKVLEIDMDQRALVVRLQTPFADYCADDIAARDVIVAGLSWPADTPAGYWQGLAVD